VLAQSGSPRERDGLMHEVCQIGKICRSLRGPKNPGIRSRQLASA
jgi:hypothetical protein